MPVEISELENLLHKPAMIHCPNDECLERLEKTKQEMANIKQGKNGLWLMYKTATGRKSYEEYPTFIGLVTQTPKEEQRAKYCLIDWKARKIDGSHQMKELFTYINLYPKWIEGINSRFDPIIIGLVPTYGGGYITDLKEIKIVKELFRRFGIRNGREIK